MECMATDWNAPSRSAVRTLMDGGEGPPMLREGCTVLRGLDWDDERSGSEKWLRFQLTVSNRAMIPFSFF